MGALPFVGGMLLFIRGNWVFDVRGAYALYVIGAIGSAVVWLIMRTTVEDRR